MLLAVMSAYGCSFAGGGVATAPTDAPVYLDGVFVLEGQWMSGAIEVTDADGIAEAATVSYNAEGPEYCLRVTQIDATGARATSEWTCAELEPCGCRSNMSAVLFVGVLGLGLKRRKAQG